MNRQSTLEVHHYLSAITLVNNNEVFKVCLEYWNKLAGKLSFVLGSLESQI